MSYLPEIYLEFNQSYPDISKAYENLASMCNQSGPLDEKTRHLVKLGISIGLNSKGAVRSHARRAIEMGATPEELRHVVLLGMTTLGFPTMIAAMKWVEKVIEKHGPQ
jgi:alkylhydroperoxidase/carboxymuconolactone decarboxylase family protein YurZ